MSQDVLDRLRTADPTVGQEPVGPDHLLERLMAEPREVPRPAIRRPAPDWGRIALPAGGLAAVAVLTGVGLTAGGSGSPLPDLAARAYAQTSVSGGEILYSRTVSREEGQTTEVEEWVSNGRSRTISTTRENGSTVVSDQTLGADGVLSDRITKDGKYVETQVTKGDDFNGRANGFAENFRESYRSGRLHESGETTFAGRPARRYIVKREIPAAPVYYLDAKTGRPLGISVRVPNPSSAPELGPDRRPVAPTGAQEEKLVTETVEALESLPPTEENLAKLRR